MALSSTIFKAQLDLSDLNRHHYESYKLTLARHPSENDQRMMLRLLAFALFANEQLSFTKGISTAEEPDLWIKNYSGEIELWIDLGLPDGKRIRKSYSLAKKVVIFAYGDRSLVTWRQQLDASIKRFPSLKIFHVTDDDLKQLASLADKNMQLHCSIQDDEVFIGNDSTNLQIKINHIE
ncbi:MAG: hypothetical protein ACI8O8_000154 [Oleiphilaceae bacterium]|jgi:uncharacterized protein YaeQ